MRFNFFAGPGSGKTTTRAWVFSELKRRKVSVEEVGEYVKAWAYEKREVNPLDQVYLFSKQHHYEYRFLKHVKNIVTDSPTFQSVIYAQQYAPEVAPHLAGLNAVYDRMHPYLNIFLHRGAKPYVAEGRWQTEAEAREWDRRILSSLWHQYGTVVELNYEDREGILNTVLEHIHG